MYNTLLVKDMKVYINDLKEKNFNYSHHFESQSIFNQIMLVSWSYNTLLVKDMKVYMNEFMKKAL